MDISYVSENSTPAQRLDVYVPEPGNGKPAPVLIYVHGGGWHNGDKKMHKVLNPSTYTDAGVILVSINYRLSPQYQHPAHVQDCAAAVRWVVDHINEYGGNPHNIILAGHSAGAQIVALLGTNPKYLKEQQLPLTAFRAVMPVDTATFDLTRPQEGKAQRMVMKMREKAFGTDKKTLIDASPALQVKKGTPLSPVVAFATANRDDAVAQTNAFVKVLKDTGHAAESIIIDDDQTHRDMNRAIFIKDSPINAKIMEYFAVW
ncbi:MAG: alpha/beta hydrolase [Rhodospirillales bacterium]|nr:alpha/beta hydrolase [Rhodospirillales bacterium]MCB9964741.1 alpha/beta hydrolase [Rhodospirillales bacterium]MCB9980611.1 alpha/beta hydrolase [Rhodospirillales bacterium]